jgi:hypothetical protein
MPIRHVDFRGTNSFGNASTHPGAPTSSTGCYGCRLHRRRPISSQLPDPRQNALFRRLAVEVFVVRFGGGAGLVDDAVAVIGRGIEGVEFQG